MSTDSDHIDDLNENAKTAQDSKVLAVDGRRPIESVLHACRRSFYITFIVTAIVDLLGVVPMLFMMNVYDRAISTKSGVTLISLTVLVVAVYVFWSALEWIRSRLLVRLSLRIDWDLSAEIFDASFRRYVGRRNVNVHQLLGDLTTLRQFVTGQGILTLMDAPFAIVFIIIGALFHPYLAIFAFLASVLMLLATYFTQKVTSPILKVANDANAEASRVAADSLRQAEATLALGMMDGVRQRWYKQHRNYLQNQVNASESSGLMGGVSGFLSKAMPSLQMALGAFLAMENLITGGMVMAASMLISKAVGPFQKLLANWKDIVSAKQSYDRLNDLLEEDNKRDSRMKLPAVVGKLEVTDAFAVPPGGMKPVLLKMGFTVLPGEAIAIVGPSAAGKTCLVRMLIGVWKPVKGNVRLDSVEVSDWDHDELGPQMGYVPQEIEFFEGTVAENIARLREVEAEKVVKAAQLIGMHDVILSFPKGYDTMLGETGFPLSGGQRQRLAIARAFYDDPKYIVMDEPNANLDEIGESILAQAISTLKKTGCSIIITTHRPRLVSVVDKLLVLRAGQQVGFGPADEMINAVRNLQAVNPEAVAKKDAAQVVPTKVAPPSAEDAHNPNPMAPVAQNAPQPSPTADAQLAGEKVVTIDPTQAVVADSALVPNHEATVTSETAEASVARTGSAPPEVGAPSPAVQQSAAPPTAPAPDANALPTTTPTLDISVSKSAETLAAPASAPPPEVPVEKVAQAPQVHMAPAYKETIPNPEPVTPIVVPPTQNVTETKGQSI